ncbi:3'-5' exonuclease [Coraliomargarita akajimensis]|uniref:Exonuclease RNase T and DNA polymerase III n=1 Tax=Coraliomargarita akajimensis (strain DSM 45221 / IAM 15411 / JCM 23193 / KCTC 12865 / 04OKA010-24) TaxID=583355 RepID=D5ELV1_CORAD|nr:3'-5' exonuclease [Coraliomargarita akajimensis]ADE53276.1 Exonuclease RNase T and DNA polymerase III [Coraliomargarita akajimensis DSM 45221]
MFTTPIHVIDFEGSRQSGIVEYGVVTLHGAMVEATYTGLCLPRGTISDRDRMQHRIAESDLQEEQPFEVQWPLFSMLRETGVLCAHNVQVEEGFLRSVWPYPKASPDFLEIDGAPQLSWGPWLDTLYLYRRIYPNLESHRLEDLVQLFGLSAELKGRAKLYCPPGRRRYHSALYDALASALLLSRLYDEPELKRMTLHWLLIHSQPSEAAREAVGQQEFYLNE